MKRSAADRFQDGWGRGWGGSRALLHSVWGGVGRGGVDVLHCSAAASAAAGSVAAPKPHHSRAASCRHTAQNERTHTTCWACWATRKIGVVGWGWGWGVGRSKDLLPRRQRRVVSQVARANMRATCGTRHKHMHTRTRTRTHTHALRRPRGRPRGRPTPPRPHALALFRPRDFVGVIATMSASAISKKRKVGRAGGSGASVLGAKVMRALLLSRRRDCAGAAAAINLIAQRQPPSERSSV
jgi:hypothetical protein